MPQQTHVAKRLTLIPCVNLMALIKTFAWTMGRWKSDRQMKPAKRKRAHVESAQC